MSENENPEEEKKDGKKLPISVSIDTKRTEEISRESERIKIENEQLKERLSQIAHKEIERKLDLLSIVDEEKRSFYHKNPSQFAQDYPTKAGSAPLNEHQFPTKDRLTFSSNEEMIRYCRSHKDEIVASNGFTGQQVLDIMLGKAVQQMKSGETIKGFSPNPEVSERESKAPVEVTLSPNMKPTQISEIREALERANEEAREKIRISRERMQVIAQKKQESEKQ